MNVPQISISDIGKGKRFVTTLAGKAILPVLMTEAFVEGGRTYQAYKRGGFTEARERITEEFLGFLCWIGAVPLIKKVIDKTAGAALKLPKEPLEVGFDNSRNSIANYVKNHAERFKDAEAGKKLLTNYNGAKMLAALVGGTALVGLALPKFNQAITRMLRKKNDEKQANEAQNKTLNQPTIDKFIDGSAQPKVQKDVAFTGGVNMMNLVNFFETTPKAPLVFEDVGVLGGRTACARNKYERNEILFRDLTSAYFYMFNMPVWAALCNKIQHGSTSRLDAVSADITGQHMNALLESQGGKMSAEAFEKAVFGNKVSDKLLSRIDKLKDGRIDLDKLNKIIDRMKPENATELKEAAAKLAELQPELEGKKILTKAQVKGLLEGGYINSGEYLSNLYQSATTNDVLFKPNVSTYKDQYSFVSEKTLLGKKAEAEEFVKDIIKKAKKEGKEVTAELVNKASKSNYKKNAFNTISGFAITALFVSTLIPKMQYWLTRKVTGSDAFPGTAEYDNAKTAEAAKPAETVEPKKA